MSYKLPVCKTDQSLALSLKGDVTAVLMAKKHILRARKLTGLSHPDVIKAVDEQVRNILSAFKKNQNLERSLSLLPRYLFLLRRGPLLGPILQHDDDIDSLRCIFLQAPFQASIRLINPPFYRVLRGDFQPVSSSLMRNALVDSQSRCLWRHFHSNLKTSSFWISRQIF